MRANKTVIQITLLIIIACIMASCAANRAASPLQSVAQETVIKDPMNPESWVEYGRISLYSKDPKEAERAFRKAIEVDKKFLPAYKHLGLLLMTGGRHQEAQQVYLMALKMNKKDSELWTAYGYCLADMGESGKALEAFNKSVEANTSPVSVVSARLGSSGVLQKMGDEGGAKREYDEAVKISPEIEKIVGKKPQSTQQNDEKFKAELWIDREDAIYRIGDEMKIFFKTNKSCRVTILIGQNSSGEKMLYPNLYQKENLVEPGKVYTLPGDKGQYRLRVKGPLGSSVIKLFAVLAEPTQVSGHDSKTEAQKAITILDKKS